MDSSFQPRRKKSDKAKDKEGRPSSKHVRQYEATMAKNQNQNQTKPKDAPKYNRHK